MSTRDQCRHCQRLRYVKSWGLCWRCYHRPKVRQLYAAAVRQDDRRLTAEPTTAEPGSPEKVAVLEERARLGLALFHPLDPVLGHHRRRGVRVYHLAIEEA
jgi:hypothetical protein